MRKKHSKILVIKEHLPSLRAKAKRALDLRVDTSQKDVANRNHRARTKISRAAKTEVKGESQLKGVSLTTRDQLEGQEKVRTLLHLRDQLARMLTETVRAKAKAREETVVRTTKAKIAQGKERIVQLKTTRETVVTAKQEQVRANRETAKVKAKGRQVRTKKEVMANTMIARPTLWFRQSKKGKSFSNRLKRDIQEGKPKLKVSLSPKR